MHFHIDHEENMGGLDWDGVAMNLVGKLLKVFSHVKVEHVPRSDCEKLLEFYKDLRNGKDREEGAPLVVEVVDSGSDEDSEDANFIDTKTEVDDGIVTYMLSMLIGCGRYRSTKREEGQRQLAKGRCCGFKDSNSR